MHVALVTHHYAPEVGAPQRRWGALVPRFIQAGHTVSVLAPAPHYPSGRPVDLGDELRPGAIASGEHGETVYRLRFRPHDRGLVSRTVDQLVTASHATTRGTTQLGRGTQRPDVVVATVPGMPSIAAGVALGRTLRTPLVVEMRDAWPDLIEPSAVVRPGWQGLVTTAVHRGMTHMQRGAAAIVTTTESFAEVLRARDMPDVHVIRNGAYLDEVPTLGAREADQGPLRILYLGTVGRSQGLSTAVRATALLRSRDVAVELRIVGPGADAEHLAHLARTLEAPVQVFGAVPRSVVFEHYAWADTLLVSLRAWGPFEWTVPSKLYELLATGRHVTGVVAGEAASIIEEARGGDVARPEDPESLADLWAGLAADRTRLHVGAAGRDWARRYADYDVLAERYLAVLEGVVA